MHTNVTRTYSETFSSIVRWTIPVGGSLTNGIFLRPILAHESYAFTGFLQVEGGFREERCRFQFRGEAVAKSSPQFTLSLRAPSHCRGVDDDIVCGTNMRHYYQRL